MTAKVQRIPCTKRIAKDLEQKIREGELRPGMKLESVRELAKKYNTCTSVCLSVYRTLEKKGLVQREAGRGTYVCRTLPPGVDEYVTSWNGIFPHAKVSTLLESVFVENKMDNWKLNPFYTDQYSGVTDYIEFAGKNMIHPGTIAVDEAIFPALADQEQLYPLDEFLENSEVLKRADFPEKLLRTFSYRGKLYALPFSFSPMVLFYNRRIFKQNGINEPTVDWTWEDLYRNTEFLTRFSDAQKHILQYGLGILFTSNSYLPFVFQNGGMLFDPNGNCVLNNEEVFEALHFFSELYALPGTCSHKFGDPRSALADLMANDLMAMMISDVIDYKFLMEKMPESDFGIIPLPSRKLRSTSLSCNAWGIHRNCRSPEAHFRFLERLYTSPELIPLLRCPDFGFPAFQPAENNVPELFLSILQHAQATLTSPSPNAQKLLSETLFTLLAHKMLLTKEKAAAFENKINISL